MLFEDNEENVLEIDIDDIQAGMIIANEISDSNGIKFLGDGVRISSGIVKKLKSNPHVDRILIYKRSIHPEKLSSIAEKHRQRFHLDYSATYTDSQFKKIESSLDDAANLLKTKIFNSESAKLINIKSLNHITDIIMNTSQSDGQLIQYIMKIRETDDSLYKHSINVSLLSCMLGKWLGLTGDSLKILTRSAMLHDLGKIKIDKSILNKPGRLSDYEFDIIKKHPEIGYKMLKEINYMSDEVRLGVLLHHEKEDGSGYPLGIKGSQIHNYAKIIAVADIFDALTSNRIYHQGMSPLRVLEMFQRESFEKLDVRSTITFIRHISDFYEGCKVVLSSGLSGKIIRMNINNISKPLVLVDGKFIDLQSRNDIDVKDVLPF